MTTHNAQYSDPKPLPAWLAMLVTTLCLASGIALLWWYFRLPARSILIPSAESGIRAAAVRPQPINDNWTDDARAIGGGNWNVRGGEAGVFVNINDGKAALRPYFRVPTNDPADRAILALPSSIRREEFVANLGLTPEQIDKIRKVPRVRGWKTADGEMKQIEDAWAAFAAAADDAKAEPKKVLVDRVKDVGARALEPTRASIAAQVAALKAILTPEQLAKLAAAP